MCQLEQVTLACGHKQYRILQECTSTTRKPSTPSTSPPDFCNVSIRTPTTSRSDNTRFCSRDCKFNEARKPIDKLYKETISLIIKYAQRVDLVKRSLPTTKRHVSLMYDFKALESKGWDPVQLMILCKESLLETRTLLAAWTVTKKQTLQDLDIAYNAARSSIRSYMVDKSHELVSVDFEPFKHLCKTIAYDLPELVRQIERQASFACLEKLGWRMPTDADEKEHVDMLQEFGKWKVGELSETRMDDARLYDSGVDMFEVAQDDESSPEWWTARLEIRGRGSGEDELGDVEGLLDEAPGSPFDVRKASMESKAESGADSSFMQKPQSGGNPWARLKKPSGEATSSEPSRGSIPLATSKPQVKANPWTRLRSL